MSEDQKQKNRKVTLSVCLYEHQKDALERIAKDIGDESYSAAVRFLITKYGRDKKEKEADCDEQ